MMCDFQSPYAIQMTIQMTRLATIFLANTLIHHIRFRMTRSETILLMDLVSILLEMGRNK